MKRIKVAHILNCVGGVDVYLRLILANINSDKFDNFIIHGDEGTNKEFLNDRYEHVRAYKTSIIRNISFFKDLKAIYQGYKILSNEKPDVIHCHSAKGGIIGRFLGLLLGIKVFYTPHAFSFLSTESRLKRKIFLFIEKIFANNNSVLLSTSESEEQLGINLVGYKTKNCRRFKNPINPIANIKELTITKTWPEEYICTVGRPSFQKNIELMIDVLYKLNKIRETHLVIMGVGYHSDKLESVIKRIDKLKLRDSVTLLNWTERDNVHNIINKSKTYISTSRYEGLPYSIIESLALSIPCVVSDCDGNRDLIINDFNGFVIKSNNKMEYCSKILELLENDTMREQFSLNAQKTFIDNYNIEMKILDLENIYLDK